MAGLADFAEITERNAPLGPKTALGIGGTAELLIRPRSLEELASLYRVCTSAQTPFRIFGGGRNILIREPLVRGVVVHLDAPAFTEFMTKGQVVKSGGGAMLGDLISFAARHGLAGLEALIGITGTVGGAVHGNAGDRHGERSGRRRDAGSPRAEALELGPDLPQVPGTRGRILGQHAGEEALDLRQAGIGEAPLKGWRVPMQDGVGDLNESVALEGPPAGEKLVEDDAEGEHVRARVERQPEHLLR